MFRKAQMGGGFQIAVLAILAVLVLGYMGYLPKSGSTPASSSATTTTILEAQSCPDSSVTMTLGPVVKWRSTATDMTQTYHRVYEQGIDRELTRDGQTLSVKVRNGDKPNAITVYYAENDTQVYSSESTFDVPCGAFTSASKSNGKHILANQTIVTFNTFNENNDIMSSTVNQTMSTGSQAILRLDWRGNTDQSMSPYGSAIVVFDYNESEFDGGRFMLGSFPKVSTPTVHTSPGTDFHQVTFKVPGGPAPSVDSTGRWTLKEDLVVQPDSAVNPGGSNTKSLINATVYCEDYFQDPDVDVEKFGVENSRGVIQCFAAQSVALGYT